MDVVDFSANNLITPEDLQAPFLGFVVGSLLVGVTILQAYQYFLHYPNDSSSRKLTIVMVCLLDFLHYAFSTTLMYSSFTSSTRYDNPNVLWSWRAMAAVKAPLLVLVQSFYLYLIWMLAENYFLRIRVSRIIKSLSAITFVYALAVAAAFLSFFVRINNIAKFPISAERMLYVAYASTCGIDCGIAAIMSLILQKSRSSEIKRGRHAVNFLVIFFLATGLLTAVTAVLSIALYVSNPSSVLYLAIEFSAPRLYANSILALFNSKSRLKERMDASTDLQIPSIWIFGDESPLPSNNQSQMTSSEGPSARADLVIIRQETTMSEK